MTGNYGKRSDTMRRVRKRKLTPRHGLRVTGRKGRFTAVSRPASASILRELLTPDGRVSISRLTEELRMSKANLAETVGLAAETLQRAVRRNAPKTQARLRETSEIIARVSA